MRPLSNDGIVLVQTQPMPPSTGAAGTSTLATAAQAQATLTAVITFSLLTTLCFLLFCLMTCWFCVSLSKYIYPLIANGLEKIN